MARAIKDTNENTIREKGERNDNGNMTLNNDAKFEGSPQKLWNVEFSWDMNSVNNSGS